MTKANEVLTLAEVVGRGVRAHREEIGATQDDVARTLRAYGLGWNRSSVAKLERGERGLSAEQFLLIGLALGVPPARLVRSHQGPIELADGVTIAGDRLSRFLQGLGESHSRNVSDKAGARDTLARVEVARAGLDPARVAASGEVETKIAKRLGVEPIEVARAAVSLWTHDVTRERDLRVEQWRDTNPERDLRQTGDERTLAASRGHVTRQLTEEIGAALARKSKRRQK